MSASSLVLGVCLQLAATPFIEPVFIPTTHFTLAWVHTIEKVRWEEDYEVQRGEKGPFLFAKQARIKGSAAGMEPPEDAILWRGWYTYSPLTSYPEQLRLTRSEFSPDYQWCDSEGCRLMSALVPRDGQITLVTACDQPLTK